MDLNQFNQIVMGVRVELGQEAASKVSGVIRSVLPPEKPKTPEVSLTNTRNGKTVYASMEAYQRLKPWERELLNVKPDTRSAKSKRFERRLAARRARA